MTPARIPSESIAITGLGLTTSVGLDVVTSCASARAGVTRWTQLDIEEADLDTLESIPLKGHAVGGFTDGFEGIGRLLRLGDAALEDLIAYAGLRSEHHMRTGFFLCLPGGFHALWLRQLQLLGEGPAPDEVAWEELQAHFTQQQELRRRQEGYLVPSLLSLRKLAIAPALRSCFFGGPAAFCEAVEQAVRRIRSHELDRCIVGGIDSCVSGPALKALHELGLLRTDEKASGFFPGEAASFVLLERASVARARGARVEGQLAGASLVKEPSNRFSEAVPSGAALTAAARNCLGASRARPELVIANLNGDEFRARDYGNAFIRMRDTLLHEEPRHWHPPASFGELGAATGAASVCMAVRGFARGYARAHAALVLLLGDDEARGAVLIEDSQQPSGLKR
ncbi:hypothetical protein HPC49_36125 [Pyxidicoccus fallax]|uniref:Beta-ketoacyl synthase-like N-terminal domain-containing protein n=1 Tax=Pyxidicoccus fallax TaxID=394095 RepID=A0A848LVT8_9BACT|nr:beta-ketoacyl synthase N-terminal-like domain-containing protein [Pyxidicoccus fallax]NMO22135.1 hypothetical protein [Pyxidicoccus fallax]NPC83639.1 hypothetical protein [Pyxidicoccus fallax]